MDAHLSRRAWLALPCLAFAIHAWTRRFLCDDAYISFRYVRNLVEGHGLVFNPGEEPVEGYSNLLHVIELAAIQASFGLAPEHAVWGLHALFGLGVLAVVVALAQRASRASVALIALLLLASNTSFAEWTTSGLETRQFTFWVLLGILGLQSTPTSLRWAAPAGLAFGAALLTRPDGMLLAALAALFLWSTARRRALATALFAAPVAVVAGGQLLWRWTTYGAWLPNTYHAKVAEPWLEAGGHYLWSAVLEHGLWLVLPVAAVGTMVRWRQGDRIHALGWAMGLTHLGLLARVGGDHFGFRPLDLYWPLLYLAAAEGCCALFDAASARMGAAAGARVAVGLGTSLAAYSLALPWLVHSATTGPGYDGYRAALHIEVDPRNSVVGLLPGMSVIAASYNRSRAWCAHHYVGLRRLEHARFHDKRVSEWAPYEAARDHIPAGLVTAMGAVGIAPYYLPDVAVVDLFGLTDATVARSPHRYPLRRLAHERRAPPGYVASRGAQLVIHPAARSATEAFRKGRFALRLNERLWMPLDTPQPHRDLPRQGVVAAAPVPDHPPGLPIRANNLLLRPSRLLWTFDNGAGRWSHRGQALANTSALPRTDQLPIRGNMGAGLLNSFHTTDGDGAVGTTTSPRFVPKQGESLGLLVGGGEGEWVGVALRSDSGIHAVWHGENSERLRFVTEPLDAHIGRELWLEVFDHDRGPWGHVVVDQVWLLRPFDEPRRGPRARSRTAAAGPVARRRRPAGG
jgi:arabinofuranosyltransferase